MFKRSIFVALLTLIAFPLYAQSLSHQKFRYLTPQEGLSYSTGEGICQVNEGTSWGWSMNELKKVFNIVLE